MKTYPVHIWLLLVFLPLLLPDGKAEADVSVSGSIALEGKYVFRGVERGGRSLQPSASLLMGDHLYAGIWGSLAIDEDVDEYNLYLGYSDRIHPLLTLDGGILYYDHRTERGPNEYWTEAYLGLVLEYLYRPSVYLNYDFDHQRLILTVTAEHVVPLARQGTAVALEAFLGTVAGLGSRSSGLSFAGASLELRHEISPELQVSAGLRGSARDARAGHGKRTNLWWGVALAASF